MEFDKALILRKLRIKAKLQLTAFSGQFRLSAHLLRGRFESAQPANLFHNSFGIELVLQPFERSIDWLTFSHNNFGHKNPVLTSLLRTRGK